MYVSLNYVNSFKDKIRRTYFKDCYKPAKDVEPILNISSSNQNDAERYSELLTRR